MNVNFQTIHFDAKAELKSFVDKKVEKLEQYSDQITNVDIAMKVVKPEVANNKEVMLKVLMPNNELVVTKTADSFEEAFDNAMDSMIRSIQKTKEKNRN
ncbi:MAG: ribosome-associated translation inhibitor RaiA [Bacteroidales bacterium]|nr:ribosome-associated translation inhibitor RaiA [Candidatus Scybalocola fimicaballi]MCQ2190730.1 ribosome-associated translation inhibitor RaiA [Paludibacteraceae bacterium]